ncbi:hypothetical protein ACHAW6_001072 [Cyclotella cf. meneghiniana]
MGGEPIPIEELYATGIPRHDKVGPVIRSTSAIVSLISSSMLIYLLARSKQRLCTTYHRIVFGMCIADIIFSSSLATFNLTGPIDGRYYVWNVKGNQASCSAQGFFLLIGSGSGVYYSCSINLYFLALVRYRKTDRYITSKIEPFLHGVPFFIGLLTPTVLIINGNINDGGGGSCYVPIYKPPHCVGYEDGEIREGFTIPCGRGRDGAVTFYYTMLFITFCVVPVVICVSLGMIYRAMKLQEKALSRYGAESLSVGNPSQITADPMAAINKGNKKKDKTLSRIVLHRAMAYTSFFFLTWTAIVIYIGVDSAGASWPSASWPIVLSYVSNIFNPLQGVFNFIIFVYPKVGAAKSRGGVGTTWIKAFASVLWSTKIKQTNNQKKEPPIKVNKAQTTSTPTIPTPHLKHKPAEEEKNEIEAFHDGSFDDDDDIRDWDSC